MERLVIKGWGDGVLGIEFMGLPMWIRFNGHDWWLYEGESIEWAKEHGTVCYSSSNYTYFGFMVKALLSTWISMQVSVDDFPADPPKSAIQ